MEWSGMIGLVGGAGSPVTMPPPATSAGRRPGVAIELSNVVCRASAASTGDPGVAGVSLQVPPGQSLALLGQPYGTATALLDVIAGLRRPRAGEVRVDGVAVHRLGGRQASRYRAERGLVSPRFPLLASLSVSDNVLAAPSAGRPGEPAGERAARLLDFAGVRRLTVPVEQLTAEERWRVMIARALVPCPRLLLAEDPATEVDSRAVDRVLDVLMDARAHFGFTLVLAAERLAAAVRCERRVSLVGGAVAEDEITGDDDGWTRSRVDRIG
jgi:predicted ABC-type transport system involved in lysophospholipase L1 biosynthesis ATPase subunit